MPPRIHYTNKVKSLIFSTLCLFSTLVSAQSTELGFIEDASYPELAVTGRALAMGNAFIAKVDDASSAFYNPAGLGTVRHAHLHISNFHLELNKGWMDITGKGNLADNFGNFIDGFSLEGQRKLLLENRNKTTHTRFALMPNFTTRYLTIGYLVSKKTKARLDSKYADDFEYAQRTDHGPYVGANISFLGGVFKVGLSAILLNRKEIKGVQDESISADFADGAYKKGSALIGTVGAKLTFPVALLPTFAVVLRNAASQDFSGSGAGAPDKIRQTIDLGFSITPQVGNVVRTHFELNWKDFTDKYGVSANRRLMLGMEVDVARTFFFRLGYGDGFGSFGIGVRSRRLEFDMTSYAVDNAPAGLRGQEDRRFAMTISSGF